ncbi:hypothetical protein CNR22_18465 [Sphingobacteriaceae bacterium]|nr:hypothetical protein CNR22_18465 [Sphingobacteriaceae bacterium]
MRFKFLLYCFTVILFTGARASFFSIKPSNKSLLTEKKLFAKESHFNSLTLVLKISPTKRKYKPRAIEEFPIVLADLKIERNYHYKRSSFNEFPSYSFVSLKTSLYRRGPPLFIF